MCDSPRTGCAWRTTPIWREQAEIRWARCGIFIVAWCHSVTLCAHAARPFQSQQSGALTRMWGWCQVQPSQKEHAIGAVHCKNEGMLLQLLGCRCIESVIFACPIHENDQRWTCTWIYLATFHYIDGFGCYHFCSNRFGLQLMIFFWTSLQLAIQFWICVLLCNSRFSLGTAGYCRTAG